MKTLEQIRERLNRQREDPGDSIMWSMCAGIHPLAGFLPENLKEGFTADPLTREAVVKLMAEYMPFAIGKARGERGLSASRSIWKYQQWLWALDDEELVYEIGDYDDYGLAHLLKIAEKYSLPTGETI